MMQIRVPPQVYRRARERQAADKARGIHQPLWVYLAEEQAGMRGGLRL